MRDLVFNGQRDPGRRECFGSRFRGLVGYSVSGLIALELLVSWFRVSGLRVSCLRSGAKNCRGS